MTTAQAAKAIKVPCETPTCTAYLTVPPDSYVPDPWTCPDCQDRAHEQQMDELNRERERDAEISDLNIEIAAYRSRR